ncbi:MAG: hypothetical protein JWL90_3510 [Chthoniobacteraceae bacterium]|nr:hypothetical protein [Chthoniobacteraceae bacterium]
MRPPFRPPVLSLRIAVACIACVASASAAEEVWVGAGLWSKNSNWLDGSAPLFGVDPTLALRFTASGASATIASNDLGSQFPVNRLILESDSSANFTIAGNPIKLTGNNPVIEIAGLGDTTISTGLTPAPAAGTITITGTGLGNLILTGNLGQTGTQSVTIAGQSASLHTQLITLQNSFAPSGGFTLQSGNLVLSSFGSSLGSGPLAVKGGNLRFTLFGQSFGNTISLSDNFLILGVNNSTLSGVISSAVAGSGLILRPAGGGMLTLTGVSTYNGATVIDYGSTSIIPYSIASTLRLNGSASVLNSSRFDIRGGGTLQIDALSTGTTNRLGDSAPVALSNGALSFNAVTGSTPQTETIGAVTVTGYSTLSVVAASAVNARLTAALLARQDRGTLLARGTNLGAAFAANTANALFTSIPAGLVGGGGSGADVKILPWVIGDTSATGTGSGFVTYDPGTGLRPLNPATEYSSTLPGAAATNNIRLATTLTHSAPNTVINALALAGGSLLGSGSLNITSGAVLNTTNGALIENALKFGSAEGIVFAVGDLTVSGTISGSGGLTKSGAGNLTLTSNNGFTGPLTINAGLISFNAPGQLGADSSAIALNGQNAGLNFTGATATLERNMVIPEAIARLQANGGTLEISGTISGAGGLRLNSGVTSTIRLTGNNTFTGPIFLTGGETAITSDASLGNGGDLNFGGGTLRLLAPWTSSRAIRVNSFATINTDGFDATWNGLLLGPSSLTKIGNGTLTITGESPFSGALTVAGGTVRLSGASLLKSSDIAAVAGGRLLLDYSETPFGNHVNDGVSVTLKGGELVIAGNPGTNVSKALAAIVIGAGRTGTGTLTLIPAGNTGTVMRLGTLTLNGGEVVIRGDALGGAAGGAFSRVVLANPPALVGGLLPDVYTADSATGIASSFAVYDSSVDSAGVVGIRPLRDYVTGSIIPANGGTTNVLAGAGTTISGAAVTINSLTIENGGSVSLSPGQTLQVSTGAILARAGAAVTTVNGGTLEFGAATGTFATFGDLTVSSALSGMGGIKKSGPGTLTLSGAAAYGGATTINSGVLRIGSGSLFADRIVTVNSGGVFDLNGASTSLGGLSGTGTVQLGASTLTLGTLGVNMRFDGMFTGSGTINIVDGGNPMAVRELFGTTSFAGQMQLTSGRLVISGALLPSGTLTVNGGSIVSGYASNNVILNTNLRIDGDSSFTLAGPGTLTGAHDVVLQGRGGLTIQSAAAHTGETRSTFGLTEPPSGPSGAITLNGAGGVLTATSAIRIAPSSALILDDSIAFSGGSGGRIPDTTPVYLRSASMRLTGNASNATTENIGVLHGSGYSTLTVAPGADATARFTAASLARDERGTFLFVAPGLGLAPANGIGAITFSASPAADLVGGAGSGAEISILPYAIGETALTGYGSGLVTYDPARGIRLLETATEYAATLEAATPTGNVRLVADAVVNAPRTINALVISGGAITGSGTLSVTSGTILKSGFESFGASVSANLAFGAAEANIFVPNSFVPGSTTSGGLFLTGVLSGTGGLTKSGQHNLILTGTNTFTGPITINAGNLQFTSMANLGADTSPIRINASVTSAGLLYAGYVPLVLTRGIEILGGYAALRTANATLEVPGTISGDGGLGITGYAFVKLSGINTYTGPTVVQGGLAITSDTALGNGGVLQLKNSAYGLRLDGPWTTSRRIVISAPSTIQTNGFEASLAGALEGSSALAINGPGRLTLTGASTFSGDLSTEATLRLTGAGSVRGSRFLLQHGSLVLDNSAAVVSDRLPDNATVTNYGGSVQLLGNSTTAVRETIGALVIEGGAAPSLLLRAPGATSTILDAASYSGVDNLPATIQGDQLGGSSGGFTRLTFRTIPVLRGRLMAGATVIGAAAGAPESFALYDTAADASGIIGVRALGADDYTAAALLANPSNGGGTPADANFLVAGSTVANGVTNAINSLTLSGAGTLTLGTAQTLKVSFPSILTQSGANAVVGGGQLILPGAAILVGNGNLTVRSVLMTSELRKYGTGTLTLSPDSFHGTLRSVEGVTRLEASAAPAKFSSITVESAALVSLNGINTEAEFLSIDGTLAFESATVTTRGGSVAGTVTGTGGLSLRSANPTDYTNYLTASGTLAYSGATTLFRDPIRGADSGVSLLLTGNGTALQTSNFMLSGKSILRLDNNQYPGSPGLSRLAGTTPVTLNGSSFLLRGSDAGAVQQNVGTLTGKGFSIVSMESAGAQSTRLNFAQLIRSERGTFGFSGITGSAPGEGLNNLFFDAGVALIGAGTAATDVPILPYAVHNLNGYTGNPRPTLVTYSLANGIRPLDITTEYASTFSAGQNVRLTTAVTLDTPVTINSLVLDQGSISGIGRITVTSGTVLNSGLYKVIANPLSFGNVEANLFCADGELRLSGPVSGTGGITVTGTNTVPSFRNQVVTLSGSNTFTGPITVNAGRLRLETAASFGPDTGEIVLNDAALECGGNIGFPAMFTLNRAVRLNGTEGIIASNTDQFTLAGVISGAAGLRIEGSVILTGANTYSGFTNVVGNLSFASDNALGTGTVMRLGAPMASLKLLGPWATDRTVQLEGTAEGFINTNGFDARIRGGVSGGGTLEKRGGGTLRIDNASALTSQINIVGGTLALEGSVGGSASVYVNPEATLTGDATLQRAVNVWGTLAPGNGPGTMKTRDLTFNNGTLAIELTSPSLFDRLVVTGGIILNGTTNLTLSLGYDPQDQVDSFIILENDGTDPLISFGSGRFAFGGSLLDEGTRFVAGMQEFMFSYIGGDGNDAAIYAVPEPGTGLLLLAAALPVALACRPRHGTKSRRR